MKEVQFEFNKLSNKKESWLKKHQLKIFSFLLVLNFLYLLLPKIIMFSPSVENIKKLNINTLYLNNHYDSSELTPEEIEILLKTLKPISNPL